MRMLLNTVRSTLNDPQFTAEHRYQSADFTRKRTLTFERVALSLLSGPIASLRNGADALCQGLGLSEAPLGVSKQALSKAYRKFPFEALIELQQQVVSKRPAKYVLPPARKCPAKYILPLPRGNADDAFQSGKRGAGSWDGGSAVGTSGKGWWRVGRVAA